MEISVNPANGGDREWCALLMASSDPWLTLGRGVNDCLARCNNPDLVLLMARSAGERCAFALLHPTGLAGSPYIASIAVAAGLRGKGVGSALMDAAERWFPGAHHIFLCVSSFNVSARVFYEGRGYTKVGEFPDYVIAGASEILMHKRLVRP